MMFSNGVKVLIATIIAIPIAAMIIYFVMRFCMASISCVGIVGSLFNLLILMFILITGICKLFL